MMLVLEFVDVEERKDMERMMDEDGYWMVTCVIVVVVVELKTKRKMKMMTMCL